MPLPRYRIVVPSRRRAHNMPRLLSLLPAANVTVAEDEIGDYRAVVPDAQLIPHGKLPGTPGGIWRWIIETNPADAVVMCGDDFRGAVCVVGRRPRRIVEPDAIRAIIENQLVMAADLGLSVFAWSSNPNPMLFHAADPFSLNDHIDRLWGVIGKRVNISAGLPFLIGEDILLSALLRDRAVLIDRRFVFDHGPVGQGEGGSNGVRTSALEQLSVQMMRARWGQYVEPRQLESGIRNVKVCVTRKSPLAR